MKTITPPQVERKPLSYLKYSGKLVEDGIIDARSVVTGLSGYDQALHFFIEKNNPELAELNIPLPLRFKKGSWVAEIPPHAATIILAGATLVVSGYLKKAAEKMAEKDFDGVGLKDAIAKAGLCVQWFVRIAKHLGHTNLRRASFRWDKEEYAGVLDEKGRVLYVPRNLIKALAAAPVTLLSEMAKVVEPQRSLVIGARHGKRIEEEIIDQRSRGIFADDDEGEEVVLPELKHGEHVKLEGVVTRGNEMTHTIGFWYQNRIITCRPRKGGIVKYKKQLFLNCRIEGDVTRLGRDGKLNERRPKIIFDNLVALEPREQLGLPFEVPVDDADEQE